MLYEFPIWSLYSKVYALNYKAQSEMKATHENIAHASPCTTTTHCTAPPPRRTAMCTYKKYVNKVDHHITPPKCT